MLKHLFTVSVTLYCTFDWLYNTDKVNLEGYYFQPGPENREFSQQRGETQHKNEKEKKGRMQCRGGKCHKGKTKTKTQ